MAKNKEVRFLNSRMHTMSMTESVEVIHQSLEAGLFFQHVVVNVAKLVNMQTDKTLYDSVQACDLINIDGQGVVLGARLCGIDVPERVAGIDLFYELLKMSQEKSFSIFLLGAKPHVLEQAQRNVQKQYPKLRVAGYHHGYFWDNEQAVVNKIKESGAKLLFVAITSPKKENFINKWRDQLGVNFVMGVGGTFDVVSGNVKRAPAWMQRYGLEWLFRVIQEPRRMFMRYLVTNTKFIKYVVKEKLKSKA